MLMLRLFLSFAKVGLLGFGGGLAIVRLIYDSINGFLDISSETFANIVAVSQITPGPLAVNTATFVGFEAGDFAGACAATFGVILPAFVIVSIVVRMIERFRSSTVVQGALSGIRPATIGLIGAAAVTLVTPAVAGDGRLGTGLLTGLLQAEGAADVLAGCPVDAVAVLMLAATVLLIARYRKSTITVLLIMGCIGAVLGV